MSEKMTELRKALQRTGRLFPSALRRELLAELDALERERDDAVRQRDEARAEIRRVNDYITGCLT